MVQKKVEWLRGLVVKRYVDTRAWNNENATNVGNVNN